MELAPAINKSHYNLRFSTSTSSSLLRIRTMEARQNKSMPGTVIDLTDDLPDGIVYTGAPLRRDLYFGFLTPEIGYDELKAAFDSEQGFVEVQIETHGLDVLWETARVLFSSFDSALAAWTRCDGKCYNLIIELGGVQKTAGPTAPSVVTKPQKPVNKLNKKQRKREREKVARATAEKR